MTSLSTAPSVYLGTQVGIVLEDMERTFLSQVLNTVREVSAAASRLVWHISDSSLSHQSPWRCILLHRCLVSWSWRFVGTATWRFLSKTRWSQCIPACSSRSAAVSWATSSAPTSLRRRPRSQWSRRIQSCFSGPCIPSPPVPDPNSLRCELGRLFTRAML